MNRYKERQAWPVKAWLERTRRDEAGKVWHDQEGLELAKAWQGRHGEVGIMWLGGASRGRQGRRDWAGPGSARQTGT